MKKKIGFFLALVMICSCFTISGFAREKYIGTTAYSDIVVYINHYAIPTYMLDGYAMIAAEDLETYGFDIAWDEYKQTIRVFRNEEKTTVQPISVYLPDQSLLGNGDINIYTTNVRAYIGDYEYEIAAYGGIYGKTLIYSGDLTAIDGITEEWVPEVKAAKVWVDGLDIGEFMLPEPEANFNEETFIYNYIDHNMPTWARPTIEKLVNRSLLIGDKEGRLHLTYEDLRYYVVQDRAGLYD
ncbi:MAG: hypothetical protein RSA27_04660 [Oscillospiraceae bacterium]